MVNRGPLTDICRILTLAFLGGLAAGAEHDPAEVLRRARQKVLASDDNIVNCTCVENVKRDFFRPKAATLPRSCSVLLQQRKHPALDLVLRLSAMDRLRLDVSMVQRGEIFSWVGASKFDDAGLTHLVRQGGIGTGAFGSFLNVVFRQDVKKFNFERNTIANGHAMLEYSFQVEAAESHYTVVQLNGSRMFTGYSGTFQVDAETGQVVRMTVTTAELPESTGECMTSTTLDLATVRIGDAQILLPAITHQRFVYPTGEEAENTTSFANCHEYKGESTVVFSPESAAVRDGNRKRASPPPLKLPPNLPFKLELTAPILADTAAAGDLFSAKLLEPLRDAKHTFLAPAGSVVEGRLLHVQNTWWPEPEVLLVLQPESLEINGYKAPLQAARDWALARTEAMTGRKGIKIMLPFRGEEHSGVFLFPGKHIVLKKGFRSDWRTAFESAGNK